VGALLGGQNLRGKIVDFWGANFGGVLTPLPPLPNIAENVPTDKESMWEVTRKFILPIPRIPEM